MKAEWFDYWQVQVYVFFTTASIASMWPTIYAIDKGGTFPTGKVAG
jgi:hypothetical protein